MHNLCVPLTDIIVFSRGLWTIMMIYLVIWIRRVSQWYFSSGEIHCAGLSLCWPTTMTEMQSSWMEPINLTYTRKKRYRRCTENSSKFTAVTLLCSLMFFSINAGHLFSYPGSETLQLNYLFADMGLWNAKILKLTLNFSWNFNLLLLHLEIL